MGYVIRKLAVERIKGIEHSRASRNDPLEQEIPENAEPEPEIGIAYFNYG